MAQGELGAARPKVSFSLRSKVSSHRRPPLPPKAPSAPKPVVENVTSVDAEAGEVLANPQAQAGARVVPKQENSFGPETRMKNIMQEADATRSIDETFDMETMDAGPKPNVGLTVIPTRAKGEVVERHLSSKELEDQKLGDDLMILPEEATLEKYEELPVAEFAEAVFRGMGWEKGKPIGRNATAVIAPIEPAKRPEKLGLGAVPAPPKEVNKKYIKPGESRPKPRPDLRAAANGRPGDVVEQTMERNGKVGERHGRPSLNAEESRGRSSVEDSREDERPSKRSHRHREEEDERYSKRGHRHRDVEDERNSKRDHRHSEGEDERYPKRAHRHSKDDDRGERRGSKDRRDRR